MHSENKQYSVSTDVNDTPVKLQQTAWSDTGKDSISTSKKC